MTGAVDDGGDDDVGYEDDDEGRDEHDMKSLFSCFPVWFYDICLLGYHR
jgi:hypothetical protein